MRRPISHASHDPARNPSALDKVATKVRVDQASLGPFDGLAQIFVMDALTS